MRVLIDGQTLATPEMGRGIGQVFLRLLDGLVVPDISTQWYIALPDLAVLEHLPKRVAASLEPKVLPGFLGGGSRIEWSRGYAAQLQRVVNDLGPEWYWNPNPLMVNVHYPLGLHGVRKAVTLHDLIPAKFPELYLEKWRSDVVDDYRARLTDIAESVDLVLPNSHATAQDFTGLYPKATGTVRPAAWASDFTRMRPLRCGMNMSSERYILYVGGFDPRKNMGAAVRAFAEFLKNWPTEERDVRLKIVCSGSHEERTGLLQLAESLDVGTLLDVTGYVDDDELAHLFRSAALFFFPSLYEGFGLPVLDALACGIPVVTCRNSSLPEVCGRHAYYCDSTDIGDMARQIALAWEARKRRPGPWRENAEYARRSFSWAETCDKYRAAFGVVASSSVATEVSSRLRIAYLSPWPPQRSGVADYSYAIVGELRKFCDVTVYAPGSNATPLEGVRICAIANFLAKSESHDCAIYHIGNGEAHVDIYRAAWSVPGIVVVHDYNIHPFMHAFFLRADGRDLYRDALQWYGEAGRLAWARYQDTGKQPPTWDFAMTEPLVARSRAAIVHSRWVARRYEKLVKIQALPLGTPCRPLPDDDTRRQARSELGLREDLLHVGVFGFVNAHKRVGVSMAAIAALRSEGIPVRLVVVGMVNDPNLDLSVIASECGLDSEGWLHTNHVSERSFSRYLVAVDVVVNLRYPTMGESSASLMRALAAGAPTIVTNINQFAEIPDSVAWKCDIGSLEVDQLAGYLRHLLQNPATRCSLGANAHDFIRRFADCRQIALDYMRLASEL